MAAASQRDQAERCKQVGRIPRNIGLVWLKKLLPRCSIEEANPGTWQVFCRPQRIRACFADVARAPVALDNRHLQA